MADSFIYAGLTERWAPKIATALYCTWQHRV